MKKSSGVAGYTLLELMIVIFIISLIYYALSTGYTKNATMSTKQLMTELNQAVKYTRSYAVLSKQTQSLVIDLSSNCYVFTDKQEQKCIANHQMSATGTREANTDSNLIAYHFFPDGSASGGHITIDTSRIDINWITGSSTVHD